MSENDVHYEVFLKKNRKSSWSLIEARPDREGADAIVLQLQKANPAGSVRMTREEFDEESRTFRTRTIMEKGPERFANPEEKTGEATIPCLTPADLEGPAARDTIRRTLSPWLERYGICPMELLHRPDMVERLDSSDTDLQHAIQKFAITRAAGSDASVHAYVRIINDLVQKAIESARKDGRKPPSKVVIKDLAEDIVSREGPPKPLNRSIAYKLEGCSDLPSKVEHLIAILDDRPDHEDACELIESQIDIFMAELLSFERGMKALLGSAENAGEEVCRLTAIYEGKPTSADLVDAPEAARKLAQKVKTGTLPSTHNEIATRILSALRSPTRLKPRSVMEEIQLARQLAQRLIAASGPNLHPDSLVEAFTHRSARLLSPESIDEAMKGADNPADQIERLLAMEDNLVGESNKKKLASYVRARVSAHPTESWFCKGPGQPLDRLTRLTDLQSRTLKGTFPKADKDEMAAAFDDLGLKVIEINSLFERIEKNGQPALMRAMSFLRLAAEDYLPEGDCIADAYARAMRMIASPTGRQEAQMVSNGRLLKDIKRLVEEVAPEIESSSEDTLSDSEEDAA